MSISIPSVINSISSRMAGITSTYVTSLLPMVSFKTASKNTRSAFKRLSRVISYQMRLVPRTKRKKCSGVIIQIVSCLGPNEC